MTGPRPEAGCNCDHLASAATCSACARRSKDTPLKPGTGGSSRSMTILENTEFDELVDDVVADGGRDVHAALELAQAQAEFHKARAEFLETYLETIIDWERADRVVEQAMGGA